jgi:hypothetical protein
MSIRRLIRNGGLAVGFAIAIAQISGIGIGTLRAAGNDCGNGRTCGFGSGQCGENPDTGLPYNPNDNSTYDCACFIPGQAPIDTTDCIL